jgi:hypothetical protein
LYKAGLSALRRYVLIKSTYKMADETPENAQPVTNDNGDAPEEVKVKDDVGDTLCKKLSAGFSYLRTCRELDSTAPNAPKPPTPPWGTRTAHSCAVVNFVDPTSSPKGLLPAKASAPKAAWKNAGAPPAPTPQIRLHLYEKLSTIFEKEYDNSTLHDVPYQHIRSGANHVIDSLPIRPILTPSYGGRSTDSNDDNDDAAGTTSDIGDPSEWHNGPYCHVYIAACESLDHYKTKVKPSLQAFVSQIESASNNTPFVNSNNSSSAGGTAGGLDTTTASAVSGNSYSAQYVIVYVPTGDRSASDDAKRGVSRVQSAFASRMAQARQRMTTATANATATEKIPADSAHSQTTNVSDTTDGGENLEGAEGGPTPTTGTLLPAGQLSKSEKELLRRFNADFPSGHVCTMTTLAEQPEELDAEKDAEKEANDAQVQKSEWVLFQKALGVAIVSGFRDRCRRYDDELRRLGSQLGAATKPATAEKSGAAEGDLSHYFLVKESLAFTYEQMHLPSEALLTYNEVRALLPDVKPSSKAQGSAEAKDGDESPHVSQLSKMALAGDTNGFRRQIRATKELLPIAHIIEQYLFARETHLLLQMDDPVKVVVRCLSFVETIYNIEKEQLSSKGELQQSTLAERNAFDFCWNVKQACDCYLKSDTCETRVIENETGETMAEDKAFARQVCNLLEFARLRLLKLGDILLPDDRPNLKGLSDDLQAPWPPWDPTASSEGDRSNGDSGEGYDATAFLDQALSSSAKFQTQYLGFAKIVVSMNRFSGRPRFATRLELEMVEIYVHRGERRKAIKALQSIASIYAEDQWSACYFLLLFRVAGIQRLVESPSDYLKTLVDCFSEKLSAVAPSKALDALHTDLIAVISDPRASGSCLTAPPLFGPALGFKGLNSSIQSGTDRRLVKKLFSVGENVCITLDLTSYLLKDIEVDAVTVSLVPFQTYVTAFEDDIPIKEEDASLFLSLKSPVTIRPGTNAFEFHWVPTFSGQYILESVGIKWQGTRFTYTAKNMSSSTVRADVVPCEPTQSIDVSPAFLVAGHEQPVRFAFSAGSDIVKEGKLQLVCSPGLMLLPPGEDRDSSNWIGSCDVPLPPCPPGETVVLTALVKSTNSMESDTVDHTPHTLNAKISTSYQYAHPDGLAAEEQDDSSASCMTTVLEAVVPTLGKPILSVESTDMVSFEVDKSMVTISLRCNAPVGFTVKNWRIDLPRFYFLEEGGDLNQSLANTKIIVGEHLSFGFVCNLNGSDSTTSCTKPSLHVELEDEHGTTFNEVLPISVKSPPVPKLKLEDLQSVPVKVIMSAVDGLVSSPVDIVYEIDMSGLSGLPAGIFVYAIDVEGNDWIVSGKVEGVINPSESPIGRLEFVAIPARPGVLEQCPVLSLRFAANDLGYGSVPLALTVMGPRSFYSISPTSHMSVASPMGALAII